MKPIIRPYLVAGILTFLIANLFGYWIGGIIGEILYVMSILPLMFMVSDIAHSYNEGDNYETHN